MTSDAAQHTHHYLPRLELWIKCGAIRSRQIAGRRISDNYHWVGQAIFSTHWLAAAHAILTCHGAPPELINEARHLAASIYSTGFQPILPFRGVRTFSNVDDGAMARKLDFFRRFEAGELTVAYTDEWSRLVNTPSSESEPATDEGEESEED